MEAVLWVFLRSNEVQPYHQTYRRSLVTLFCTFAQHHYNNYCTCVQHSVTLGVETITKSRTAT